MKEISRDHRA